MKVHELIDYLRQFDPQLEVVMHDEDVQTPMEYVSLESAFLAWPDEEELNIQGYANTRDAMRWAVRQEREACAMEADYEAARWPYAPDVRDPCESIAAAIRARGKK